MNDLAIFNYGLDEIRTITLDGVVWFIASDVCKILEIKNTTQAISNLSDGQRSMFNIGRQGNVNIVTEGGLYKLIFSSKKKQAIKFTDWITDSVLPVLRRTGKYYIHKAQLYTEQEAIRMLEKASFRNMTDSLKDYGENERMKGFAYSTYNNLIYKKVLNKTAKQIKNEKNLNKNDSVKDYIDKDSLIKIENLERLVDSLLRIGYEYDFIKQSIDNISFNKLLE